MLSAGRDSPMSHVHTLWCDIRQVTRRRLGCLFMSSTLHASSSPCAEGFPGHPLIDDDLIYMSVTVALMNTCRLCACVG